MKKFELNPLVAGTTGVGAWGQNPAKIPAMVCPNRREPRMPERARLRSNGSQPSSFWPRQERMR